MVASDHPGQPISNRDNVSQPCSAPIDLVNWLEDDADLIAVINGTQLNHHVNGFQLLPYFNKALQHSTLVDKIVPLISQVRSLANLPSEEQGFESWLQNQYPANDTRPRQTIFFENHLWSTRIVQNLWLIVRGVPVTDLSRGVIGKRLRSSLEDDSLAEQRRERAGRPSGTDDQPGGLALVKSNIQDPSSAAQKDLSLRCFMLEPLSTHQTFVRDFDWSSTPIGPISTWNSQLIETVRLTLTATEPASVFWDTDMTSIYNEAFITIAGQKHPAMMGDTPKRAFAEVWEQFFEERLQISRLTRAPFSEDGLCLMLERLGYSEETFMTFTFLPLLGWSGEVVGFYHTVTEVTQQILSKRRMSLLLSASEVLSRAQDLQSFWSLLIESLQEFEYDTPFVVLYSVSDRAENEGKHVNNSERSPPSEPLLSDYCRLEGYLGYPPNHEVLLDEFQLLSDDSGFAPHFRSSMDSRGPKILRSDDGSLPAPLVQNLQTRGYSAECNSLAICPLRPTNHDTALGFLAIGLSSRRPYDEDYQSFVDLLVKNISSSLASVILLEDEKQRGRNNAERAAYERAQLTIRLQERELENQLQEHKFMLMANQVPVGIFDLTPLGETKFCNQAWYEMTNQKPGDISMMSWIKVIHVGDRARVQKEWLTVSVDRRPVSFEGRLQTAWQADPSDKDSPRLEFRWFLARMYPITADDGTLVNIIGCITDISFQRYSMAQQIQRVEEAVEAKRQQENFIDMTSHEMRNPLNAMLLCAEELSSDLQTLSTNINNATTIRQDAIASSIESVQTILYCGRHQKRIIDDVLTLSKLDARLLQIVPIEVEPVTMVENILKLFESEVRAQGIDVQLQISDSMQKLDVGHLLLDPSRVVQILVNFIANAIKFTKTEDVRHMLIRISSSLERPSSSELAAASIQLIPHGGLYQDLTAEESWGKGEPVYLHFLVQDTGPGISKNDMVNLFGRFAQARPKTHAQYGGSGLGLFISQQLAELQGGRVGIASELGVGSSFYFYIKSRRATVPKDVDMQLEKSDEHQVIEITGEPSRKSESTDEKQSRSRTANVLVVEDNLVNQKVLKRQLQKLDYNVLVANHGEEALEIIRQSNNWKGNSSSNNVDITKEIPKLHLILMDIEMPVMDGRECIQRIREHERQDELQKRVPVIALTANARPEQISGAKDYGFDEVISKPFQLAEVVHQMQKFLGQESGRVLGT